VEKGIVSRLLFVEEGSVSTLVVCGGKDFTIFTLDVCGGGECFCTRCLWRREVFLHMLFVEEGSVSTLMFVEEGNVSTFIVWRRGKFVHSFVEESVSTLLFLQEGSVSTVFFVDEGSVFFCSLVCGGGECCWTRCLWRREVFQHWLFIDAGSVSILVVCGGGECFYTHAKNESDDRNSW
jgi:putative component of toxin-antitoxin plasmid stabilization module